jgi:hypothetical protein
MKSDHANVEREGFTVPLIGIPPNTVLETCDLCHDYLPIRKLEFTGTQMLCEKCRTQNHAPILPITPGR